MLEKKEIEMNGKTYVLSKFPAWEGVLLMSRLPLSMLPKIGDFAVYKDCLAEVMGYVGVVTGSGQILKLVSPELINNHVSDWETTIKLFKGMMEYNTSFLQNGGLSDFLNGITSQNLPEFLARTLQAFSQLSSQTEKQP